MQESWRCPCLQLEEQELRLFDCGDGFLHVRGASSRLPLAEEAPHCGLIHGCCRRLSCLLRLWLGLLLLLALCSLFLSPFGYLLHKDFFTKLFW
jgi:hypothetical protein